MKVAIMIDGGFYRRRAQSCLGEKTAQERANELIAYCHRHLKRIPLERTELYRIFYYDCPPMDKKVYHPLLKKTIDFGKTDLFTWTTDFFEELRQKRKVALRLGKLSDEQAHFNIRPQVLKKLLAQNKSINALTEKDFNINVDQKGVDIKIGIDIASLAYKKQVERIILISGDSDFIPAAKLARREGIDFILDPLYNHIKPDLYEHIDGLYTCNPAYKPK
ncbi:NYN domain-containing protein [Megasphaera sp. DISK 18]|uniref:NYN domain-containing protein n=1 Tax=Megasphaera sp. DISK 18 TaxID=1776081 RepID=UPI000807077E|nr:NYN domain-containing protein [Megasphaera sp. DISK 18]OBZ32232.1 nuclease [Megasphaera sp. DISK 18]